MSDDGSKIDGFWETIKSVPAFSRLTDKDIQRIVDVCQLRAVGQDDVLVKQGESADCFYIVVRGRFNVLIDDKLIAEIVEGEPIGEIAFFAEETRSATVAAARDSEVIVLNKSNYEQLFRDLPELNRSIIVALAERLSKTTQASSSMQPRLSKIVSVMSGGENPVATSFINDLHSAMSTYSDWLFVKPDDFPKDILQAPENFSIWLSDKERGHAGVVLVCPESELAQSIIRNSDSVLLACDATAKETLNDLERDVFTQAQTHARQIVVYRKQESAPISGTERWLTDRPCQMHHHVALGDQQSFARLARFITGNALGVVMCGGGVLGTAHVGLMKSLEEHGYSMDMAGGTSVGAAMSAAYAALATPDHIIEQCDDIFVTSKAMNRLMVPLYSVIDHRPFDAQMQKHYGAYKIEDLPLNYFAVTTSLSKNDIKVLRRGDLWKAIRSSASIPAVLPPFIDKTGEVLVDGALIDNTPVNIMRDIKAGPNIIFSIKKGREWKPEVSYNKLPGRLGALRRFLPFVGKGSSKFPSIFDVLSRTMVVNSRRLLSNLDKQDDIFIEYRPPRGTNFLDWRKGKELFDGAYEVMNEAFLRVDKEQPELKESPLLRLRAAADLVNNLPSEK